VLTALARALLRSGRRLLDALLVGLVLVALSGVVLGKVVPLVGHPTLVVGGSSMTPAVPLGAAVVLDRITPDQLRAGDIVSLEAGSAQSIFTHRVVRVVERSDGIWIGTKGDANLEEDPTLTPAAEVIGRVGVTLPYAGYLLTALSVPMGVLFLVGAAGALVVCIALVESAELRVVRRANRILRKVRVSRPADGHQVLPSVLPMTPSATVSVVRRLAAVTPGADGDTAPYTTVARLDPRGTWQLARASGQAGRARH
jgi:signal peptidase I